MIVGMILSLSPIPRGSESEIVVDHPHLTPEDVYAAVAFAADHLAQEEIIFAGG